MRYLFPLDLLILECLERQRRIQITRELLPPSHQEPTSRQSIHNGAAEAG